MELKTSQIKSSVFKNEYNGANGTIYYHDLELSNGDKGSVGKKVKNHESIAVGKDFTYELTDGKFKHITQPQGQNTYTNSGNKKSFYQKPIEVELASYSMSYAKDLVIAKVIQLDQMSAYAEKMYEWQMSKQPKKD